MGGLAGTKLTLPGTEMQHVAILPERVDSHTSDRLHIQFLQRTLELLYDLSFGCCLDICLGPIVQPLHLPNNRPVAIRACFQKKNTCTLHYIG
jgi:hypothetical protein